MGLNATQLKRLRAALEQARPTKPIEAMVAVAKAAPANARLTIDFAASGALGVPLIVLEPRRPDFDGHGLTARECEVAELLAAGLRNREIAHRLGIAVPTVKDHVHRVLSKTGFPSRAALAARRVRP